MSGKVTGILPGILLIVIVGIVILVVNSNTNNKSNSNYEALKDYMSVDNIKSTLAVLTECGFKNYDIERDDSLDTLDGDNTIGFRIKASNYNAVMYLKDNNIYSIRYADKDLYRNNNIIQKITDVK